MSRLPLSLVALCAVACGGDGPEKDSAAPNPCLEYVEVWSACTVAAELGVDPTLEDPEAFCADNSDEAPDHWECLIDAIDERYCTNSTGLTHIQAEFAECSGY